MDKKKNSESGPPSKESFMDMKGGKGGKSMKDYNGGCEAELCCGNILEYGVWKEEYFCYNKYATMV